MLKKFLKSHPIHNKIVPSLDILMLFRPTLFFSVWVMTYIGMYISSILNNTTKMNITEYNIYTIVLFAGISFVCAATFILNQISDIESDKINKKISYINPNFKDNNWMTPLSKSILMKTHGITKVLLNNCADPNADIILFN